MERFSINVLKSIICHLTAIISYGQDQRLVITILGRPRGPLAAHRDTVHTLKRRVWRQCHLHQPVQATIVVVWLIWNQLIDHWRIQGARTQRPPPNGRGPMIFVVAQNANLLSFFLCLRFIFLLQPSTLLMIFSPPPPPPTFTKSTPP